MICSRSLVISSEFRFYLDISQVSSNKKMIEHNERNIAQKKVLIVLDSLGFGGAQKQIISLVNNLNVDKYLVTVGYLNKQNELLNQILYLGGIPIINFILIYSLYFCFIFLINKFLNKQRDKILWKKFLFRLMIPGILGFFLHLFFYIARKASGFDLVLIIIDKIIVLSIVAYTLIVIKTMYKISILKTLGILLFVIAPITVIFSGKVFCPYFLWLN